MIELADPNDVFCEFNDVIDFFDQQVFFKKELELYSFNQDLFQRETQIEKILTQITPLLQELSSQLYKYTIERGDLDKILFYQQVERVRDLSRRFHVAHFFFGSEVFCPYATLRDMILENIPYSIDQSIPLFKMLTCPTSEFCVNGGVKYPDDPGSQERLYTANGFFLLAILSQGMGDFRYCIKYTRPVYGDAGINVVEELLLPVFAVKKRKT